MTALAFFLSVFFRVLPRLNLYNLPVPFTIPNQLFLIAGPCVIESEAHALHMARAIAAIAHSLAIPYIFKASYDKANRTSISSFRGPGLEEGTRILQLVRDLDIPVLTDVHDQHDCDRVAEHADILQIPAFLCRQTDLLIAAARTGKTVNIKKGQFAAPADMRHAVQKVRDARAQISETSAEQPPVDRDPGAPDGRSPLGWNVLLTERGTTFGYHNLVVDMRSLAIMRAFAPVVFDATHSVQLPSANSSADTNLPASSGGQPQFIPLLARAAVAAGIDGIFLEVHDNPPAALSDGPNALPLNKLSDLLEQLLRIHAAARVVSS